MRNLNTVGLLAGIALAVGIIGYNIADGNFAFSDKALNASIEAGMFLGHLEIIQTDVNGNIIKYLQTDNAIVSQGENCTALDLFGATGSGCNANPGVFNVVALTNTGTSGLDSTTLAGELSGNGLTRIAGTATTLQTAGGANAFNRAQIQAVFTFGTGSQGVLGAGLFNSTDTNNDALFAIKDFSSPVTLNTGDQLTVNWQIDTSGSTAFS